MGESLRIAFIGQKGLPARWGGVEAHVQAVATRLARRGHRVVAYVRRWYAAGAIELDGVSLRALPTLRTKHLDAAAHSALAAVDALFGRYDVVHFHAVGPSLFCLLPKLGRARVVATIHGLDYRQEKWGPLATLALLIGERSALTVADRALVVSRALRDHYARRGFETQLVGNGVERPRPLEPDAIRTRFGLQGDDFWLFMGRWTPNKRVLELVSAYRATPDPPVRLVLAGDDPSAGRYGRRVREAARGCNRILLPGLVDGALKAELLSNARGFISASDHEGLPLAVLEAMSYGLPCLVSDIPAHREALDDGSAGLVRDLTTVEAIASALAELASLGRDARRTLGRRARDRAENAYDWERVVDRYEAVYRDLLAEAR